MDCVVFSARPYEIRAFERANDDERHELVFVEASLGSETVNIAAGRSAVCLFTNDDAGADVLAKLVEHGVRHVALRTAGFNQIDVEAADDLGIDIARVPAYSPAAVAEHAVALMLCLNRKIHRTFNRVREQNFSLDGLVGFDMQGRTAGVVGGGRIGCATARILRGFGCEVLIADPEPPDEARALDAELVELDELLTRSDIVTLHCPLTPDTEHLIGSDALQRMKRGAMLINTSRGAVLDTRAVIDALKSRHLGSLGIDVYEEEGDLFFRDLSDQIIDDEVFARLTTFPNVLITGHQGFLTHEALTNIAETTLSNLDGFERGDVPRPNRVTADLLA